MPESTLIVIPTYNEKENLPTLVTQLREQVPTAHLLIVDDGSPDGTGSMADSYAATDSQVHVLHRTTKDGLGRAYVAGFTWGLEKGYTRLVQMDADLSHNPCDVPRLLAADADLVIGSRYVAGGGTANWGLGRRLLSRGGCLYARTILGLPLQDLTGGFKCWRRAALEAVNLPEIRSNGYSFQIEMTWRALQAGFRATEVPILFTDRVDGVSKMSKRIVFEAVGMVWRLRLGSAPAAKR
ncbi:polyprenol monophosphomannose synthase [Armatimonas rosea]|uniref:Dolichol-phosphate mannosyltransferase n=1 Tax=Armatimonas rosea TaxID=685828 RepID=A0A7W9W8A5_ARMRO|nr:polyprenol monophosphomannose synthase [Armatimonas rosea]MBB6052066.1 dolichol-phosphate mannosyltransferase [Armatimonas rosea]